MENILIKIGKAAHILGVSIQTLRKWERSGELVPARKTQSGTRYYRINQLTTIKNENAITICYARVSSHDQKEDLKRQEHLLQAYCISNGWEIEIISDLGSGMNYRKKGLKRLLDMILQKSIKRVVITHKDRLLRFGAELIFTLCEIQNIEIVIINKGEQPSFEEELAQDVLEIITVFSARLYGSRSHKHKKMISELKNNVSSTKNTIKSK